MTTASLSRRRVGSGRSVGRSVGWDGRGESEPDPARASASNRDGPRDPGEDGTRTEGNSFVRFRFVSFDFDFDRSRTITDGNSIGLECWNRGAADTRVKRGNSPLTHSSAARFGSVPLGSVERATPRDLRCKKEFFRLLNRSSDPRRVVVSRARGDDDDDDVGGVVVRFGELESGARER